MHFSFVFIKNVFFSFCINYIFLFSLITFNVTPKRLFSLLHVCNHNCFFAFGGAHTNRL